ncbi:lamin tail domain-containing protein [Chloroflexales bacterium ZM16-3]|nr:lamin tail domain-containing protein [Chloroflexales bacterium ZM16-3]
MSEREAGGKGRRGGIVDAAGDVVTKIARVVGLPLRLLPKQSRTHARNAIRELGYGFAKMPRGLAEVADVEIDRWEKGDAPTPVGTKLTRDVATTTTPVEAPVPLGAVPEPVAEVVPEPVAEVVPEPVAEVVPEPVAEVVPEPVAEVVPEPVADAPVAPVVATSTPITGIDIAHIEYDPPGDDVEGEYVLIWNTTDTPIDMSGWELSDGDEKHTYIFMAFTIESGAEVKLWTKRGADDENNLYWNNRSAIWNNDGDTGTLKDTGGTIVSTYTYTGKVKSKGTGKRKKSNS